MIFTGFRYISPHWKILVVNVLWKLYATAVRQNKKEVRWCLWICKQNWDDKIFQLVFSPRIDFSSGHIWRHQRVKTYGFANSTMVWLLEKYTKKAPGMSSNSHWRIQSLKCLGPDYYCYLLLISSLFQKLWRIHLYQIFLCQKIFCSHFSLLLTHLI